MLPSLTETNLDQSFLCAGWQAKLLEPSPFGSTSASAPSSCSWEQEGAPHTADPVWIQGHLRTWHPGPISFIYGPCVDPRKQLQNHRDPNLQRPLGGCKDQRKSKSLFLVSGVWVFDLICVLKQGPLAPLDISRTSCFPSDLSRFRPFKFLKRLAGILPESMISLCSSLQILSLI